MDWWLALILMLGVMVILMLSGMPVAVSFLLVDILGAFLFLGGDAGIVQLILNMMESLTSFSLLPVPLFILMGEVMFHSRLGFKAIDVVDQWIGKVPGRLSLLAILGGAIFSTMSGSTMATTAILGSMLVPDMQKRGYHKTMSIGPVMGSGGLSMLIPPSALAILLAALNQISVGGLLIAGILPGCLIAFFYAAYVVIRCLLQPHLAPPFEVPNLSLREKLKGTLLHVLPLGLIIFLVIGLIFLGIATPSEAAALGALGTILLASAYGKLGTETLKKSIIGTVRVTSMMFMIIVGSMTFSQIMAFSGASAGLIRVVTDLDLPPIMILIAMQVLLLFLGCFMDNLSMVMIAIPIFLPIVNALHFDTLWFSLIMLINMEMANTTPPFGLLLFVMKGVAPPDTTMGDIYKAGIPFLLCDAMVMVLVMIFPQIALYLPGLMK
ncbi:MAG: TRAP transporter large permease subunit [Deltaproteobacteria bacterium]|nr:TRAP transporter large permease subunit [Deltaproteobacteria bacterium]MBW2016533.1 TRAP transporter large permease subunit [Deltaproteobacteria bacterium]MBW2128713.1 TRAP transporter large permease subunit [Deltaproteobacteria bacterium]MBW2302405.1 TRAP transporter large permease subunit [Deltaproteobacteria bacterium]